MAVLLLAAAAEGSLVNFSGASLLKTTTTPVHATASLQLNTDGTITYTNGSGDSNWYDVTTVGIGNSYWVKATVLSGGGPTSGSGTGVVLALSAALSWTWTTSAGTPSYTTSVRLDFYSDSGGTALVASNTFSVSVVEA